MSGPSLSTRIRRLAVGQVVVLALVGIVSAGLLFGHASRVEQTSHIFERDFQADKDEALFSRIGALACLGASAWLAFTWFGKTKDPPPDAS